MLRKYLLDPESFCMYILILVFTLIFCIKIHSRAFARNILYIYCWCLLAHNTSASNFQIIDLSLLHKKLCWKPERIENSLEDHFLMINIWQRKKSNIVLAKSRFLQVSYTGHIISKLKNASIIFHVRLHFASRLMSINNVKINSTISPQYIYI